MTPIDTPHIPSADRQGAGAPGAVTTLTASTFDEALAVAELPVLVDFTAGWCPPCAQLEPVLDALATEQADRLSIVRVDIDADPGLAARHRVMSAPTMVLYIDGQLVRTLVGARSRGRLLEDLAPFLT